MKILHVIPSIAAVRGGPGVAAIAIAKYQREVGIDAEIVTTNDDGNNLLDVPLSILQDYRGVPIRFFSRFSPFIASVREFIFSPDLTAWLWQNIRNYDLIHVHTIFSYPATVAMAIARAKKKPYLNSPHGMLCQWSLQQKQLKKEIYLRLIEKANLRRAELIHLTDIQEQKELELLDWNLANFVEPLGLDLPNSISDARNQLHQILDIPLEIPVILFLSRLHPKKGLDYLIPALGKLRDRNFAFVLAGSGDPKYEAELKRLLQEHHLSERSYKLGFVDGTKKNICLQGADLYVLTSYSENFGISVLEALGAGTPVLVSTGVALSDLVKVQNLGWVTDLEIQLISDRVQEFLNHPEIGIKMGNRAAQYVAKHYTWEQIASNLEKIYINVLLH